VDILFRIVVYHGGFDGFFGLSTADFYFADIVQWHTILRV